MTRNDDNKNWKNRLQTIFEQNKSEDEAALEYLAKKATDGAGTFLSLEISLFFLFSNSFK